LSNRKELYPGSESMARRAYETSIPGLVAPKIMIVLNANHQII